MLFTPDYKCFISRIITVFLAAFCLISPGVLAQDARNNVTPLAGSNIETDKSLPSIEQSLVPEGVFATQLVKALKLGPVTDEARAEKLLSSLGIEPENGWISDYPVTPAMLGDIEKSVAVASENRMIGLTKEQAIKSLDELKSSLGFDVTPRPSIPSKLIKNQGKQAFYRYDDAEGMAHFTDDYDSIPKQYRKDTKRISLPKWPQPTSETNVGVTETPGVEYETTLNPDYINQFYDNRGPPVVTYYSPPNHYAYLYTWIPYPFWSTGFYFPGYFILNNFHRRVFFNRKHFFVSRHVGDHRLHRHRMIKPATRPLPGRTHNARVPSRRYSTSRDKAGAKTVHSLKNNRYRRIEQHKFPRKSSSKHSYSSRRRDFRSSNSRSNRGRPVTRRFMRGGSMRRSR